MDWQQEYSKRTVPAEEIIKLIKPTDLVVFSQGFTSRTIVESLLKTRKAELRGLKVFVYSLWVDFGWAAPSKDGTFDLQVPYVLPTVQKMLDERQCDYVVSTPSYMNHIDYNPPDMLILELTPPDEHGFCGFGHYLWHKRKQVKDAKIVVAEINPDLIRTNGTNFVHVSEIDYFVQQPAVVQREDIAKARKSVMATASKAEEAIAQAVASLVKDGDTIEIGARGPSEWVPRLGVLDDKRDLGIHTEIIPYGLVQLMEKGVVTCERKNIDKGKAVCTQLEPSRRVLQFGRNNPMVDLRDASYVVNPMTIGSIDNMVAINSIVSIDLTGQTAAESIGPRVISGVGGQLSFVIGANYSRGGRSIITMPSTAANGTISRVVPQFPDGTIVSVPRTLADYVVTEYGIAQLKGKTVRQRAKELIAIAHPDHRAELKKQAEKLF